jgi:hypothetical protein
LQTGCRISTTVRLAPRHLYPVVDGGDDMVGFKTPEPGSDESLAMIFLNGFLTGQWMPTTSVFVGRQHYPQKGSEHERRAREALVRLLRDFDKPLDPQIRQSLAALFDHRGHLGRKLDFSFLQKGKREDPYWQQQIALHIEMLIRSGLSPVVAKGGACKSFKLTKDQVRDIWKRWGPMWSRGG